MKEIELIQQFEEVFTRAAKMAMEMKGKATHHQKLSSGIPDIDIVTSADLAVQEYILEKIAQTELINCELVAEEDTPSKKKFAKKSDLVLTLDPIDGTRRYADGKKMYSTIVMIHDKKRPLYTFSYYPEVDWGLKIILDEYQQIGKPPVFDIEKDLAVINYTAGKKSPKDICPVLYNEMIQRGYRFVNKKDISPDLGATGQFILGYVGGFFIQNGSAVDCLVAMHYALANKLELHQAIDISKDIPSKIGGSNEYDGYYLALNKGLHET